MIKKMSTREKIMGAFRTHPKLTTLVLGLGITVVIVFVTGVAEPKLVYASGGGTCQSCFYF